MSADFATGRSIHRAATTALCAIATALLLTACGRGGEESGEEIRPVRTMTIEQQEAGGSVSLTGTLQAQAEVNESFRIDGRLIDRAVDIGDRVKPGQLLARLDPMNEQSALQSARAQLGAAEAQAL